MTYKLPCEKRARRYKLDPESNQRVRVRKIGERYSHNRRVLKTLPLLETTVVLNKLGRVHRRIVRQVGEREYHATKGWRVYHWPKSAHELYRPRGPVIEGRAT